VPEEDYEVWMSHNASEAFLGLPLADQKRLKPDLEALAKNPRPQGSVKLKGTFKEAYRIRRGDYRVVYRVDDAQRRVDIDLVAHRGGVYKS
jgi:mRNA interferase RelE/StbE